MIPVRVPHTLTVHAVHEARTLQPDHSLYGEPCPVCDRELADEPYVLVAVGIEPHRRTDHGWTTGGAVAVHAACVGPATEQRAEDAETAARQAGQVNRDLTALAQGLTAQAQELAGQLTAVAAILGDLKAGTTTGVLRQPLIDKLEAALKPSTEDQ